MSIQKLLFESEKEEGAYTGKIEAPIYEPSHEKPHVRLLADPTKTKKLIAEIDA